MALQRKEGIGKLSTTLAKDFKRNKYVYLMLLPVIAYYIIFKYWPMYGIQIAFKDYRLGISMWKAEWVGFKYFIDFFSSVYFVRVVRNTLIINLLGLIFVFPAPIILALLLNEVKNQYHRRLFQTFTYLPYFISIMVICGIITDFFSQKGILMHFSRVLGYKDAISPLLKPEYFRPIYIGSDIWQWTGWGSILYLGALSGINPELYESARIDGASRWKQMIYVTLPGIAPTIIIMLILRLGSIMDVGFDKVFLLYKPVTYSTADVISTFVYRKGLNEAKYGYSSAVGLFNSVINFIILFCSNTISRRISESSLF